MNLTVFFVCVFYLLVLPRLCIFLQVGILFFLFEFFSDQLLAFMVLSVVWLCEVYSVVSVRTRMCIRFFPQVWLAACPLEEGILAFCLVCWQRSV